MKGKKVTFTRVDSRPPGEKTNELVKDKSNVARGTSNIENKPGVSIDEVLSGINKYYSAIETDKNARSSVRYTGVN